MAIRQTQSYLRSVFSRRRISPQRRLGQNFLIDLNIHDLIVKSAEVGPGDLILEVGPGTGALTSLMAEQGASVVAVDVDPAMVRLTAEAVDGLPNVRVLHQDALKTKSVLNPDVLDAVRAGLAEGPDRRFKLVANLPYNIATPLISNLLVHPDLCPSLMVVTIQREMADRMCAGPSSSSYGSVSVILQALADVSIIRTLPPTVFWPQPKVDSAVVSIRPDPARRARVGDVAWFHTIVRQLFFHRRKYVRHVLASLWRDQWTRSDVDAWLESQGLSGQIRAESLEVDRFIGLARALRERWGTLPGAAAISPGEPADGDDPQEAEPES